MSVSEAYDVQRRCPVCQLNIQHRNIRPDRLWLPTWMGTSCKSARRCRRPVPARHIEDNQFVRKADLLVELDPTDYQVALAQAEAQSLAAQGWLSQSQAQVTAARAAVDQAAAQIETAQVSLPLVRCTTQQARRRSLLEALHQDQEALDLARDEYQHGLVDFLTVLNAQRAVLAAQNAQALSDQSVSTVLVALYKALGGGWPEQDEQGPARLGTAERPQ